MSKIAFKQKRTVIIALLVWFSLAWSWTLSTDSLSLSGSRWQGLTVAVIVSIVNVSISTAVMWHAFKFARNLLVTRRLWQALPMSLFLFAFADFLVAWLSAIIWLGPQGSVDNVLPLGSPSLLLIHTPVGFAARIVGFYGLAAFGWLSLCLLFVLRKHQKTALYAIGLLSLLSFVGWILNRIPSGSTTNAIVVNESLDNRIPPVDAGNTDFILFPEYGLDGLTESNVNERIRISTKRSVKFIGSEQFPLDSESGNKNTLIFGESGQGVISKQDKHRLIPGGEDLPYIVHASLLVTNQKGTLDYFNFAKKIKKGGAPLQPIPISTDTTVGAAVCSSIISPEDYRRLTNEGATILTNSASLGVFNGSAVFAWQQISLAKFMALANARYFLQSANDATSYALDMEGHTTARSTASEAMHINARNNSHKTPYTKIGEWMAVLGGFTVLVALFTRPMHRVKLPTKKRS